MSYVFDLDDTLYQNQELNSEINARTLRWIESETDKSLDETKLVEETQKRYPNVYNSLKAWPDDLPRSLKASSRRST